MSVLDEVKREIEIAESKFPEYNSSHEGYSVIAEELDELWQLVKERDQNYELQYNEAKQVACTAIRYMKMCLRLDEVRYDKEGVQ